MGKPILYGSSASRALRSLWAIEETGIAYEHVPTNFRGETKTPEYLSINPNGRIPALVDGDVTLFESMAINLYLAKTYQTELYPKKPGGEAQAWQWSFWGLTEIEPLQMQLVVQKIFTAEEKRDHDVIARAEKGLKRPLEVLNGHLHAQPFLLGDVFTIADLNVAAVMALLNMVKFDYSDYRSVNRWAEYCYSRGALARARQRD